MVLTARDRWKAWLDKKKEEGLCLCCGKKPARQGRWYCTVCAHEARVRRRNRYHRRLKEGLCPHCGGKREDPGIIGCRACNEKNAERRIIFYDPKKKGIYQKNLMDRRRRQGLCPVCGRDRNQPEFTMCISCRKRGIDNYYKHRDKILERARILYDINYKPQPLCSVCLKHSLKCKLCGKMMKVYHGEDTCLFTCKCGAVVKLEKGAVVINK